LSRHGSTTSSPKAAKKIAIEFVNAKVNTNINEFVMKHVTPPGFQVITALPDPLGLFFRPGRADHTTIDQVVSEGRLGLSGAVLDPTNVEFQHDLVTNLAERRLRTVLDPLALELATPGGLTPRRRSLEWADPTPHRPSDFSAKKVDRSARLIAEFVKKHNFNALLAPTHFLAKGANDPWLLIDRRLTARLRKELDAAGAPDVPIYYPLAAPTAVFFDALQRRALREVLNHLQIEALWFRISPFGANNGAPSLQNYIIASREFHSLALPIVAEKAGTNGLALLAFGAVSGLDSTIALGEQFNFVRLNRRNKPGQKPFAPRPRVYLQQIGLFLARDDAAQLFQTEKFRPYACADSDCCQKGFKSTLADPRRHFANCRMEEVNQLGAMPPALRPSGYLQQMLRPADEHLQRLVAGLGPQYAFLQKSLAARSRRLHGCRKTLTAMQTSHPIQSVCNPFPRQYINIKVTA
jgi:hypothetical protein